MILATVGLAALEDEALALAGVLEADGARAQASQVRQAYIQLLASLNAIAGATAQFAEEAIKQAEASSRVRPDTGGAGGPRLGDYIGKSDPLTAVEGSVGINDEDYLDSTVPWWWTNEGPREGGDFSGHIGREIRGLFQPGSSRPSPAEFRTHPLFSPGRGGKGVIESPIPARHFVRDGGQQAATRWHAQVQAAKRRFLATCDRALASAPRPKPPTGRRRKP